MDAEKREAAWVQWLADCLEVKLGYRHDLLQNRYKSSLLQLKSFENVQEIPQITAFHAFSNFCNIEPRSLAMMASKLPNLDSFSWNQRENEKRDPRLR